MIIEQSRQGLRLIGKAWEIRAYLRHWSNQHQHLQDYLGKTTLEAPNRQLYLVKK
ncbi:Z-ring formation inhibitor MciZ [Hazenella coriacea]|nr:Z-ring formation inhibitor MciZ [Hazenella coriacea]